jgi:hypothetical protein
MNRSTSTGHAPVNGVNVDRQARGAPAPLEWPTFQVHLRSAIER